MTRRFFTLIFLVAAGASGQGVVTTIAGTDWLFPADGEPAVNAPLSASSGPDITIDAQGNLYLCDLGNAMVMRVGPDGIIHVVAGNGLVSVSGDGGPAINASLYLPTAITTDQSGTLYIVDSVGTIRKVTPDGIITSIAGVLGGSGFSGDEGPANQALFNFPVGLAIDASGSIYIADTFNFRIRKITPDGIVHTIAGTGIQGFTGDGGQATAAELLGPSRLALDRRGNLYFVDAADLAQQIRGVIRKIDANGVITTVAGGGTQTGDGILATQSSLVALALAIDPVGNLYIADRQTSSVRKVDLSGMVTTVAGSGVSGFGGDNGPALKARFAFNEYPALALDANGNIYVGDEGNGRVRKIDTAGMVTTIAGNGLFRFSGNGGPATSATIYLPWGLAQDAAGNIFVSEPSYGRIRRIAPDHTISVFAGSGTLGYSGDGGLATSASLSNPEGLDVSPQDGSLVVADTSNCVIRQIDPSGVISTIAGTGKCGFGGDSGPAVSALLNTPGSVAVAGAGILAITETEGNRVRIVINGTIFTIAGNGMPGYSGDGGDSRNAQVARPHGIRFYNGYLYFCDTDNNVVRRISLTDLTIETVAGNGKAGYSGDGGPAKQASLNSPYGLTFDAAGNLYIADAYNDRIRGVSADGTISTFGGGGEYLADGVPSTYAIMTPYDVLVDTAGNLLFADVYFNRVRAVLADVPSFTAGPDHLSLTAQAGAVATDQTISLTGTIPGVLFITSADAPWLQLSTPGGAMPSSMRVSADASSLAPGTYQGVISITAVAKPFMQTIPVSFTVTSPGQPTLNLSPSTMQFSFVQGASARSKPISVSNTGGGSLPFSIAITTSSGDGWLQVSTTGRTLGAFGSTSVNIMADPMQLPAGTYSGAITISSDAVGQKLVVPVTMTVTAVAQTILIPQTGLTFYAVQGSSFGSVLPQTFSILNTGQGQMRWSTSAQTLSGGSWLYGFPTTGVTDAALPLVPQVRVDIDPSGLGAGIYYGTVEVTAPDADNTPQVVSVALNILSPGTSTGPIVQPTGLVFTGVAGGEPPGSQTVLVQNTSGMPLTFTSGRVTVNTSILFNPVPGSGTVLPGQPLRIVIQPITDGLRPDVYRGTMTLSFSDGSTRSLGLVLVLTQAGSSSSAATTGKTSRDAQSSCSPKTLVPVFTLLSDGLSVPAGFPGQVAAKVIDDCGNPMTAGGVTVTFTNGDPPVRLTSLRDGSWAGTWTAQHPSPQTTVTALAAVPERNLTGQVSVKMGVYSADQIPVIASIVNAANNNSQALAPGSMVTLSGSNMSGGSVVVAGKPASTVSGSDGQMIAVLPYGISANTTQQVVVSRGVTLSVPQPIIIATAAPGIFTMDGSQANAVDVNNKIIDPGNPATAGDSIVISCTGLGEVTPDSQTISPVFVSIGGMDAQVTSSGLKPGAAGVYQVTVTVPAGVSPGNQVPVVLTAAGQSSAPANIAIH